MKRIIYIAIYICACLILAFLNIRLFWDLDFVMDTSQTIIENYRWFLGIGLATCVLLTVAVGIAVCILKRDVIFFICLPIVLMMVFFSFYSRPDFEEIEISQSERGNISDIDWATLQEYLNSDVYYLIYIGREDCSDCAVFEPILQEALQENEISAWYYSTSQDRDSSDFQDKMDEIDVSAVPSLRIVGNGEVEIVDAGVLESKESLNTFFEENDYRLD